MPQVLLALHLRSAGLSVMWLFLMLVVLLILYLTSLIPSVWYLLFDGSGTLSDVSDRSLLDARVQCLGELMQVCSVQYLLFGMSWGGHGMLLHALSNLCPQESPHCLRLVVQR